MMYLMVGCLCFGVLLILINIYQLRSLNADMTVGDPDFGSSRRPIVWINGKKVGIVLNNIPSLYLTYVSLIKTLSISVTGYDIFTEYLVLNCFQSHSCRINAFSA